MLLLSAPKPRWGDHSRSVLASPPPGSFPGCPAGISNDLMVPGLASLFPEDLCKGGSHRQLGDTCV